MMTELLYYTDSYLKEFEAEVVEARADSVILRSTAFYPRGGGQPGDQGELIVGENVYSVKDTFKDQHVVLHVLDTTPPPVGLIVKGVINWNLRYLHMRYHSAIHIICGVMYRLHNSIITGGMISSEKARVDFDVDDLGAERVAEIEQLANKVVKEGKTITSSIISKDEALRITDLIRTKPGIILLQKLPDVRVVEIKNFDIQADGGTHVSNTMEVGVIRITKTENKGRHNKRIEIVLQDEHCE